MACAEETQNGGDAARRLRRSFSAERRVVKIERLAANGVIDETVIYKREGLKTIITTYRKQTESTRIETRDANGRLLLAEHRDGKTEYAHADGRLMSERRTDPRGVTTKTFEYAGDGTLLETKTSGAAGPSTVTYSRVSGRSIVRTERDGTVTETWTEVQAPDAHVALSETRVDGQLKNQKRVLHDGFGNLQETVVTPRDAPPIRTTYWYGCW